MNKFEKLIKEKCPNGVEFKKLGEIGKFYGGLTGKTKDDFKDGNSTFISYKNVYNNPSLDINPKETVLIKENEKQRTLEYGDIIFTGSSETPDECGISSVVTEKPKQELFLNSFCFFLRLNDTSILDPNFSKHLFRSHEIRKQIGKTASGVTRFNVSKEKMAEVEIPVPPLEVQREIVRVLDSFTFLSAELSAELQARKKQYEYYRDSLLMQKVNKTSIRDLIEVADVFDSLHQTPSYVVNGYNMIRVQDIKSGYVDLNNTLKVEENIWRLFTNKYKPQFNDIVVSRVGSYGNFALIPNDKCCLGQNVALIHPKINPKYLYHVLSSNLTKKWIENNVKGSSQKSLSLADIKRIPVLCLEDSMQKKIADVLDNFETICNNLNIGLPAEIEARQKQYEYYRDMLLTFAETGDIMPQTDRQTDKQ